MTKPKQPGKSPAFLALENENINLKFRIEQLKDQIRRERRRADQHADEIAYLRQQQVEQVRRRLNGVVP